MKGKAAAKLGKDIRAKFMEAIPGLEGLLAAVSKKAKTGQLRGLDGRPIKIGAEHAALNYLLQGGGAIVCKKWLVDSYRCIEADNLLLGHHFQPLGFIHDEVQLGSLPECSEKIQSYLISTMPTVGTHFKLNVQLAAEAKEGKSWADTH